ncbi:MAG: SDR family oxidoreductase [Saprospiraceae bacterium]|nr:SDR family oxidoreductase [Bacteroidia bacterium]NNE16763.1 SDR family oxidoreductase [Saprospiraceae bacterium]NNL92322.1 SDR family oxidoreductase [Saprospiraceae bacterium]
MNAIITGATKGIGLAIAQKFVEKNINVAICSRNMEDLEETKSLLQSANNSVKVLIHKADVSIKAEVEKFAEYCLEQFTTVDILINNAGIFIPGKIMEEEEGALEAMIETNLYSAYHLSRAVVPSMQKMNKGFVINIASIASFMAYPNGGSYSISKFALKGFSQVLREELKEDGIKVTTVMPGATWSNSWVGVDLPESRLMQAKDIAEAVWSIFEMSPAAVLEELIIRPQLGDL